MQKKRYVPSALAAAVLAGLALSATALPAVAATSDAPAAPRFLHVAYDGDLIQPGDHDEVAIGTTHKPVFSLATAVAKGSVSVKERGKEICSATITSGGASGIALCEATAPLRAGHHVLVATTKSAEGTSQKSDKLIVDAYEDGAGGGAIDPATPNPGETDPGFSAPGRGIAAPDVRLGETSGGMQQILLDLPKESGTINIYDASGKKIVERPYDLGGSELGIWVNAPFGEKTEYAVEYQFPAPVGNSPRTPVTIDRTSGVVDAPTFAFEPGFSGSDLVMDVRGIPGATIAATNSATGKTVTGTVGETSTVQLVAGVASNALNEYTITQTVKGVESAPLTHVVDKRTPVSPEQPAVEAPGGVDAGFSPVEDPADAPAKPVTGPIDQGFDPIVDPITTPTVPAPGDADAGFSPIADPDPKPVTPRVLLGTVYSSGKQAVLYVDGGAGAIRDRFVVKTDDGKEHSFLVKPGTSTYEFPVDHSGAQDVQVWRVSGDKQSDVVDFHLDAG